MRESQLRSCFLKIVKNLLIGDDIGEIVCTDKIRAVILQRNNGEKMKIRILLAFSMLAGLFPLTYAPQVAAQTCRVVCGVNTRGQRTYKEVYEYDYVSVKPEFPGGESALVCFINRTRKYPAEAYKKGVQGRVTCSFVVNCDGSVSHIKVLRGVETTLNAEAIRILSQMPAWAPGSIDGHPVPVRVIYPIPFRK